MKLVRLQRYCRIAIAGIIFVILVVAVVIRDPTPRTAVTTAFLDELVQSGHISMFDPVSLHMSLEFAFQGTDFEDRWQVNEAHQEGWINIYIINSAEWKDEITETLKSFRRNAIFAGNVSAIILDFQLIELITPRYFTDVDWGARATMLTWIVGHEVGHLVHGHGMAPFAQHRMLEASRCSTANHELELEADSYLVDMLTSGNTEGWVKDGYIELFLNMFERELAIREAENMDRPRRVTVWKQPMMFWTWLRCGEVSSHPEYIVRAYTLLRLIAEGTEESELVEFVETLKQELRL